MSQQCTIETRQPRSLVTYANTEHAPPPLRSNVEKLFHSLPLPLHLLRVPLYASINTGIALLSHITDGPVKGGWNWSTTVIHALMASITEQHPPQGRHSLSLVSRATDFTYPAFLFAGTTSIVQSQLTITNSEILREQVLHVAATIDTHIKRPTTAPPKSLDVPVTTRYVSGEWVRSSEVPKNSTKIVLYLHGGAHIFLSPRSHRGITSRVSRELTRPVFALDYRLALEAPFPGAIEDALAAYCALIGWNGHLFGASLTGIDQPYTPKDIVLVGDSSGGSLCMQLMLVLRELGIPQAGGAILLSPFVDAECTSDSYNRNRHSDILNLDHDGMKWAMRIYSGKFSPCHSLVSPVNAPLHDLPPILIQAGDSELVTDDAVLLYKRLSDVGSAKLELYQDQFHVFQAFSHLIPVADIAYARCAKFVDSLASIEATVNTFVEITPAGKAICKVDMTTEDDCESDSDKSSRDSGFVE
ncbi:hypothetical protein SmJEL517_g03905 [Synchytrium microbalum]|uniref:Alpha/beta hydrolase fold-3 domain-containing protein n=1 Tax=Synchytrium microbalum TaxID=1806994 RepID=A0A507C516_9FUNG|nr:uncharacterized protein SmJEL517_g03905 [Synchytrium microbalum]TPX33076.1 hypothetical protein SmJEL517_g03905 [Synchytrium microbalum]